MDGREMLLKALEEQREIEANETRITKLRNRLAILNAIGDVMMWALAAMAILGASLSEFGSTKQFAFLAWAGIDLLAIIASRKEKGE